MKKWLVEIRLKDWEPSLHNGSRVVDYEEVKAWDAIAARHVGFNQFAENCKSKPSTRKLMQSLELTPQNCCAPDAVELNE
jgi:hypothetical protein